MENRKLEKVRSSLYSSKGRRLTSEGAGSQLELQSQTTVNDKAAQSDQT